MPRRSDLPDRRPRRSERHAVRSRKSSRSESAASSGPAFSRPRITPGVLSRGMDAAARQLLLAATRRRPISGASDRGGGPAGPSAAQRRPRRPRTVTVPWLTSLTDVRLPRGSWIPARATAVVGRQGRAPRRVGRGDRGPFPYDSW